MHIGKLNQYTSVGILNSINGDDDERIRDILKDKIIRLPKDKPNIIIANIESPFIDDFSISDSLFGRYRCNIVFDNRTGKCIDQWDDREANGLFLSKRISAVIIYKKSMKNGTMDIIYSVYRNPNKSVYNQLTDEELKILMDLNSNQK